MTKRVPVPFSRGSWLLGHLPELQKDWLGTLCRWQKEHGDFVTARRTARHRQAPLGNL